MPKPTPTVIEHPRGPDNGRFVSKPTATVIVCPRCGSTSSFASGRSPRRCCRECKRTFNPRGYIQEHVRKRYPEFAMRVLLSNVRLDPSGCWLWTGHRSTHNGLTYGLFSYKSQSWRVHRIAYTLAFGPIPSDKGVCHTCDTPLCVRLDHLFLGSQADNMQDAARKGRLRHPDPMSGEAHPQAKLTQAQVDMIRSERRTDRAWAEQFGVSRGTVQLIRRGRTWR